MGVMACNRDYCPNIMCDNLLLGVYICWECYAELEEAVKQWPADISEDDWKTRVEAFYRSGKGATKKIHDPSEYLQERFALENRRDDEHV